MVDSNRGEETAPIDVLCVDDDPGIRTLARDFLEREDDRFRVETADSAETALKRFDETYDVVVSDYQMPGMDGLEFLEAVRERNGVIPFIVFTGQGREAVAMEALNLGADRYLQKRGAPSEQYGLLAETIRQEVGHYRAKRAHRASQRRYRSLFENNPIVIWEEDYSAVKAELDELAAAVDDLERYFEANPDEVDRLLGEIEVIDVNRNALAYHGADSKSELMDAVPELFVEESHAATTSMLLQIADGKQHFREERVTETLDGTRVQELMEVYVPDEYADDYARVYVTSIDITERKHAEEALDTLHEVATELETVETANQVYDILLAAAVDVLEVDHCVVFERDGEDLTVVRTGGPEATPDDPDPRGDTLARETARTEETVVVNGDGAETGSRLPGDVTDVASAPLGEHGVLQVGVTGDRGISERELTLIEHLSAHCGGTLSRIEREHRLRQSDARLEALSRAFPDYAFQIDAEGRYRDVLLGWVDENGRLNERHDLLGKTLPEVLNQDAAESIQSAIDRALETGTVQTAEYELQYPDHTERFEGQIAPLTGDDSLVVLSAREITDRHRTEQELRERNAQLAELSSALSHDLGNLLTVLDGHLTMAAEGDDDHLDTALETVGRMETLLDEVLTITRQTEDSSDHQPVDLSSVAKEAWSPFSSGSSELVVDCDRVVSGDEARLRRLFENLYSNAVEHGGERVTVEVGGQRDGFFVADDGPGIPPDRHDDIFEYGYTTTDEGTGFGLSIVRKIAHEHGWEVTVSESATGGARFEFTAVELEEEERVPEHVSRGATDEH